MNINKLERAENIFLNLYPEGFESPELQEIAKKHKMVKMQSFVSENFSLGAFEQVDAVFEAFVKLISRSSLVSVFEKAKFKDVAKALSPTEKEILVMGLKAFLYGDQEEGFEMQVRILTPYKLAKWPILTVLGLYMNPDTEVLVKPTTVKGILKYFEVTSFKYTASPNYEFYAAYRKLINDIKAHADQILQIDNAAFCGFLMMSIKPE